jgi:hypothetical protein
MIMSIDLSLLPLFAPFCGTFILACVGLYFFFRSTRLFDDLLFMFYSEHKDVWERAGRPTGWWWRPSEFSFVEKWIVKTGRFVSLLNQILWLFITPDWIAKDDSDGLETIHKYRLNSAIFGSILVVIGVVSLLIMLR